MSPFFEDAAVCKLAASCGLVMSRYEAVEITDEAAVAAAGMTCTKPDYSRIRKALLDGVDVPGAQLRGVEYILRRKS